jgi:hypothetical protein
MNEELQRKVNMMHQIGEDTFKKIKALRKEMFPNNERGSAGQRAYFEAAKKRIEAEFTERCKDLGLL